MSFIQSPSLSVNTGNFRSVYLSGSKGIAGSTSNLGLYYTNNSGQTWTPSNIDEGNIFSVSIDPASNRAIAGSGSNLGIYYSSGPI